MINAAYKTLLATIIVILNRSNLYKDLKGQKMPKSTEPLPLRLSDEGIWEVENSPSNWIKCQTKEDADILSNAPVIEELWLKTRSYNEELSAGLDKTADKLEKYNILSEARRFRIWAKLARGVISQ
ncbi:MAG: hypothetical protein JW715_06540 [Sedimentisphaerales bacterium]|nr:hypothetical protein [Sedimentisphaerales bacterium]